MKLIFLDIDGVLNSQIWDENRNYNHNLKGFKSFIDRYINPFSIELLNDLIKKTNAKIVISSSHRKKYSVEELKQIFNIAGLKGEIIGKTPVLSFTGIENYNYSVPRGCEIKAWLETNKNILNNKIEKVPYVIFDDDSDMLFWQRENYFRIDGFCGLTPNIIFRATKFLNRYENK